MPLSALERRILNCIQEDIPLEVQPFRILAERIGVKEEELLAKIKELKEKGIIRSFRALLNHRKLKFKSTLLALKVPSYKVEDIAKKLSNCPEITHCYLRKGEHNLWVVFIYKNGELKKAVEEIAKEIGKENIMNLETIKQFKLKNSLKI